MNIPSIDGAAGTNPALRRALEAIQNWATRMEQSSGITPDVNASSAKAAVPPQAVMSVVGSNGHFTIKLTNPDGAAGPLLHEIKSSLSVPLVSSNSLLTHASASPATAYDVNLPGTNRFFQLRSRYVTSNFNKPQVFGPVFSGVLSSASLPLLNTQYEIHTNPPAPIMIQPAQTPLIRILATIVRGGTGVSLTYNAAPVDLAVDDQGNALTFDTYFVYTDDPMKAGGDVTYKATLDSGVLAQSDARVAFGAITLRSIGGGVLFPNDLEGGPAAGTLITLADGTGVAVETLLAGQALLGLDPLNPEILQGAPIAIPNVPCFTIATSAGRSVTISADHELQYGGGGRASVADLVVGDLIDTGIGQEQITAKTYAGLLTVYNLPLSRNHFHQGGGVWCG